jgi:hypothetical protein
MEHSGETSNQLFSFFFFPHSYPLIGGPDYTFFFSFFLSLAITLPSIDTKQIWPYINSLAIVVAMIN